MFDYFDFHFFVTFIFKSKKFVVKKLEKNLANRILFFFENKAIKKLKIIVINKFENYRNIRMKALTRFLIFSLKNDTLIVAQ